VAKANRWEITDTEIRKLGERSRLETCVVLALNACMLAASTVGSTEVSCKLQNLRMLLSFWFIQNLDDNIA
jgi:hypothetical protein